MKKILKRSFTLVLSLMLIFSLASTAFAASSTVTFEGKKEKFTFAPGSTYSKTDLFQNFKGVMPGDKLEETIVVRNRATEFKSVKIYMRAETHDNTDNIMVSSDPTYKKDAVEMKDFLSQLHMKVYNGSTLLFDASPDELDGLAKNVLLGTVAKNGKLTLTVELEVPIELGNEYANRVGEVDWIFTVEGSEETGQNDPPKTGDAFQLAMLVTVMAVSAAAVVLLVVIPKRKKNG